MFYRFNRFRSLKTKAKQIDKMRRRSRWDWDVAQRPFFNARHVRCASHFGGPKFHPRKPDNKKSNHQEFGAENGFELTEGEKKWKDDMERMRKRVEQDPYEAVFGKRFPQFWSPLLNPLARWTSEELGLKTDSFVGTKSTSTGSKKIPEPAKSDLPNRKDRDMDTDTPNGQLTNYSYSASTAWDSRTNKTRGQEWDSISGVTKSFEYDPITNRMVQTETTPSASSTQADKSVLKSSVEKRASAAPKELRKPIDVPTANVDHADKTSVYFPSLLNTSVTASPAKTSAITKAPPESDLDLLTAEDIRASMRGRQERAHYSTKSSTSRPATLKPALQRMQTKESPEPIEPDDSAAHESTGDSIYSGNIPRDWDKQADLLQANRILRTRSAVKDEHVSPTPYDNDRTLKQSDFKPPTVYMNDSNTEKTDNALPEEPPRVPTDNDPTYKPEGFKPPTVFMHGRKVEEGGRTIDEHERTPADNDRNLDRYALFKPPTVFMNGRKVEENGRVVPNEPSRVPADNDPTYRPEGFKSPTVYMHGRKVEENGVKLRDQAESKGNLLKPVYDPTADKESRYQRKVAELKRELNLSYEQSTINSEMHVERIRELERALQKARDKNAFETKGPEHIQAEGDFDIANVTKYAKDSSKWYKRPSYHPAAETNASQDKVKPDAFPRERDPVMYDALAKTEREHGITYHGASKKDTLDLLKEMAEKDRQISESRAGRNPCPDPLSAQVDKEMAEKHKYRPEDTKSLLAEYAEKDRQVREVCAGRNPFPDPLSSKVDKEMAEKYKFKPEDTAKLLEADAQREREWAMYVAKKNAGAAETGAGTKKTETKEAVSSSIQWAEPPVYKVLAYDSGNDMFSTATTSSNFTSQESPISIQDALSQLYQPARFVPHFAELQKEGYQVIYGTKDLLLFKKRQEVKPSLVDHGLLKPFDTQAEPITSLVEPISSKVNPIDGTAASATKDSGKPSYVSPGSPSYISPGCPDHKTERKQNPRVYREERVFSGRKKGGRHRSELTAEEIELLRKLKGNGSGWASRLRWALGVGVGASAVAYGVGVAVEKKEQRDRERWEDVLEGRYGRRSSSSK